MCLIASLSLSLPLSQANDKPINYVEALNDLPSSTFHGSMLIYTAITSVPTLLILFIFVCSAAVMRDKSLHDDGDDNNDHDDNGTWSFLGLLAIDWLICYVNIMITPLRIRLEDTYLDIWSLRSANFVVWHG